MLRSLTISAFLAGAAMFASALPASAQNGGNWNFSVGAGTDNRSKDASKSDGEGFVWAQAEWESQSGFFYLSPAVETIKSGGSDMELEFTGGIRPQWAGFDFDLNVAHKWRPDADQGQDNDAWEFTADMKRSIGPANARLRVQHSPDGTGSTKAWTWIAARAGWDFTDKLTVNAEIGKREQDNSIDYVGYNIGAGYMVTEKLELDLRWHGTDVDAPSAQYADKIVASIAYAF